MKPTPDPELAAFRKTLTQSEKCFEVNALVRVRLTLAFNAPACVTIDDMVRGSWVPRPSSQLFCPASAGEAVAFTVHQSETLRAKGQ